jgi:hypothetical protein
MLAKGGTIGVNFAANNAGSNVRENDFMVASTIVHEAVPGFFSHLNYVSGRRNVLSESYARGQERLSGIFEGIFAKGSTSIIRKAYGRETGVQQCGDRCTGRVVHNYLLRAVKPCDPYLIKSSWRDETTCTFDNLYRDRLFRLREWSL